MCRPCSEDHGTTDYIVDPLGAFTDTHTHTNMQMRTRVRSRDIVSITYNASINRLNVCKHIQATTLSNVPVELLADRKSQVNRKSAYYRLLSIVKRRLRTSV